MGKITRSLSPKKSMLPSLLLSSKALIAKQMRARTALELVNQRSAPAMFIVGPDNRLLYANEQTLRLFKDPDASPRRSRDFVIGS
jgi:hypothetical protein